MKNNYKTEILSATSYEWFNFSSNKKIIKIIGKYDLKTNTNTVSNSNY
ncbi:hypothetical protein [Spiroplasma gladiatoris]|nr:hypothetical protein [Spiroplasma gladiatoris]